jgi:hypothetical protein
MCRSLKAVLGRQDNRQGLISFIDISDPYYDPLAVSENGGVRTGVGVRVRGSERGGRQGQEQRRLVHSRVPPRVARRNVYPRP